MEIIKKISATFSDIAFPVICACCGSSTAGKNRHLCVWCTYKRFENAEIDSAEIKPENIQFIYSMWHFDKGGYLQDLLHNLKYNYLRQVGVELGRILARRFLVSSGKKQVSQIQSMNPLIVPVPLHQSKRRKRGYNQASALAMGISQILKWDVVDRGIILRQKKTKTQTGLNTTERSKNLKDAFIITKPETIEGRFPIIVDDVITTGATTFELASTITAGRDLKAGILTAAKA